ncbi:hypothetical protein LCGC14_2760010, partial [marine sediment metagenome]
VIDEATGQRRFDTTFGSPLTAADLAQAQQGPGGFEQVTIEIAGREATLLVDPVTKQPIPGAAGGPFFAPDEAAETAEALANVFAQGQIDIQQLEAERLGLEISGFEEDRAARLASRKAEQKALAAQTAATKAATAATLRGAFSTPAGRLRSLVSRGRELGLPEVSAELLAGGEGQIAELGSLLARTGTPPSTFDVDLRALSEGGFVLPESIAQVFPELAGGDIPLDAAGLAGAIPTGQFLSNLSPAEQDVFNVLATDVFGVDLRELEEAQRRLSPTAGAADQIIGAIRA